MDFEIKSGNYYVQYINVEKMMSHDYTGELCGTLDLAAGALRQGGEPPERGTRGKK